MKDKEQIEELGEEIFLHCSAGLFENEANSIAEFVINKQGYRKASDVAREIFAEIERNMVVIDDVDFNLFRAIGARTFAELKKKYTEQE